jgi:hypothetical protein
MRRVGLVAVIAIASLAATTLATGRPVRAVGEQARPVAPLRAAPPAVVRVSTRQLDVNAYASTATVAAGGRFTLVLEVLPKAGMHVYAPGAKDYRAATLTVGPQPFLRVGPTRYPASETYHFTPLDERVPVFRKPFRLTRDVVLDRRVARGSAPAASQTLAISGALEYQACDDNICYNAVSVPVTWTVSVRPAAASGQPSAGRRAGSAPVTP